MSDPTVPQRPDQAHEEELQPEGESSPSVEDLEEPSTEKEPAEVPRASKPDDPEPSHQAVGIGVTDPPFGEEEADPQ